MNIFDFKIDKIYLYNVLYRKNDDYSIKRLEDQKNNIIEYFSNIQINASVTFDNILDYSFCMYILEINSLSKNFLDIKKAITQKIKEYDLCKIDEFIIKNYLKISQYNFEEIKKIVLIETILKEIIEKNLPIDKNKLIDAYPINIFDNKKYLCNFKEIVFKKLSKKSFLNNLLEYRYIPLLNFLKSNQKFNKDNNYNKIINDIIDYTLNDKNIFRKSNNCEQLIFFLEDLKDYRVKNVKLKKQEILKEKNDFILKNGIKYNKTLDFSSIYDNVEKEFKLNRLNDFEKLTLCFLTYHKKKICLSIENIELIEEPIIDSLISNSMHSYYKLYKKEFIDIILKNQINLFFNYYLKYVNYDKLQEILQEIIKDIYEYVLYEKKDNEIYNREIKNIITTIKRYKDNNNENRNFDMYVNSFYLTNFLEKILREIYIKACLNNNEYIGLYTLKNIFEDDRSDILKTILGETLFLWLKYYLYYDKKIVDGIVIREGFDIRNNIAHAVFDYNQDFSECYSLLLILTLNLLFAIEIKMLLQPTYKTERILKNIFKKS